MPAVPPPARVAAAASCAPSRRQTSSVVTGLDEPEAPHGVDPGARDLGECLPVVSLRSLARRRAWLALPSPITTLVLRRGSVSADDALPSSSFDVHDGQEPPGDREAEEPVRFAVAGAVVHDEVVRILEGRGRFIKGHAVLAHVRLGLRVVPLEVAVDDRGHPLQYGF